MTETVEQRALRWAASHDSGTSSKAIFGVMTGNPPTDGYCYPHDGADFGRCHRLLALIPEWRGRLAEMKAVGPEWAALVDQWDVLESLYDEKNGGPIYDRIQAILGPIEAKRDGLIKIGPGMSMYFGSKS